MLIKALVFDFDGLILDTETADYLSWKETYQAYGCQLPLAMWTANIGSIDFFNPYTYLEQLLGQPVDRQAVKVARKERDNALLAQMRILPGVEQYLTEAQQLGLKIGLASSSPHQWVDGHLARLGLLEQFDVICCRDDVGNRAKPDPAVYVAALNSLGVQPHEAIALEDSAHGLQAAKQAGLWCVVVPNAMTEGMDFTQADYRLGALSEQSLTELLQRLAKEASTSDAED